MTCRSEHENDHRQMDYARRRFEYTELFRAWFRDWSAYERVWTRIILEPEDVRQD